MDINQRAFLKLVKAGLWETEIQLSPFGHIDYTEIYRLAEEQSVVGLVTSGIEQITDIKVPQTVVLQFVGTSLQIEQRNTAMNQFVCSLFKYLCEKNLNPVLLKGQGIAQCYAKPMWRSSGDIDILFSKEQYEDAKKVLLQKEPEEARENGETMEYMLILSSWPVELHGSLNCLISKRMDERMDEIQERISKEDAVRQCWEDNQDVSLPSVDNDIIVIFTHIVKHYFRGGIGLRQVCDWCRLLWYYRDSIDRELLKTNITTLGLESEWKAFAFLAVNKLGMPQETMPLYEGSAKWARKANTILETIMRTGNFGHNLDVSYQSKYPVPIRKVVSLYRLTKDSVMNFLVFPMDSLRSWSLMIANKIVQK